VQRGEIAQPRRREEPIEQRALGAVATAERRQRQQRDSECGLHHRQG